MIYGYGLSLNIVTGVRLPREGLEGLSPVTAVSEAGQFSTACNSAYCALGRGLESVASRGPEHTKGDPQLQSRPGQQRIRVFVWADVHF